MIVSVIVGPAPCHRCRTLLWYVDVEPEGREWRDGHGLVHECRGRRVEKSDRSHRNSGQTA